MRSLIRTTLLSALVLPLFLNAAQVNWTGSVSDNLWTSGGNWSSGTIPQPTDITVIDLSASTVLINTDVGAIETLYIGSGGTSSFNPGIMFLTIENGGSLDCNGGDANIGNGGNTGGFLTVSSSDSMITGVNQFSVGNFSFDNTCYGQMDLKNGGQAIGENGIVGNFKSKGVVNVEGSGSKWTLASTYCIIGNVDSIGILNISMEGNGGEVSSPSILVGNGSGNTATLNLGNQGLLKTNSLFSNGGTASVNFYGGTLQAVADAPVFINGFSSGQVQIISGGTLTLDSQSFRVDVPSSITGGGNLVKIGSGQLTISNTANDILNVVEVQEGTLAVFGTVTTSGGLTVIGGATLSGTGTITGDVANYGILSPGASIGTLNVVGNYNQEKGSSYFCEINTTTSDFLNVDGAITIGKNTTLIVSGTDYTLGMPYYIAGATGGIQGTFTTAIDSIPDITVYPLYLPDLIEIFLGPGISNYISGIATTVFSSINETNMFLGRQMVRLQDRLVRGEPSQPENVSFNTPLLVANTEQVAPVKPNKPWCVYLGPTGNVGKMKTGGKSVKFNYWSAGARAGVDYAASQVGAGLLLDYDYITSYHSNTWEFSANEVHGAFYATYSPKKVSKLAIDAILGGSFEWYDIHRKVVANSTTAVGKPNGGELDALLGAEYRVFQNHQFTITPLVNLQYIYLNLQNYTESGAGIYNIKIQQQNLNSLRTSLGTRLASIWHPSNRINIHAEVDVAWQYEYLDQNQSVNFTPVAFSIPFSNLIVPFSGRNFVLAGIDLTVDVGERLGWEASYDFQWNESFVDNNFYTGIMYKF